MKKVLCLFTMAIISLFGLVLSACNENYDKVSLVPSVPSVRVAVNETQTFNLEFVNYNSNMKNDVVLNNVDNLFEIVSYEATNNKVFYEIEGIRVGKTTVEAVSYEGNKSCTIEVEVYQNVTEYQLKDSPYILKELGKTYQLADQNYFEFLPYSAEKPEVTYRYQEDGTNAIIKEIRVVENSAGNSEVVLIDDTGIAHTPSQATGEFYITASLDDYPSLNPYSFPIKVISPINFKGLNLIKKGYANNYLTNVQPIDEDGEIVLITSDPTTAYYEFEVKCDTSNVKMLIETSMCVYEFVDVDKEIYEYNSSDSIFFSLQGERLGEETIKLKLYYDDFSYYVVEKQYKVSVLTAPTSINTNNISTYYDPIILYDYYGTNLSSQNDYNLTVNVLDKKSSFDLIEVKVVEKTGEDSYQEFVGFGDYLYVYYKDGLKTEPFSMSYADFNNNTSKFPIAIHGLAVREDIFILLTVKSSILSIEKTHLIPISIKEGVKNLAVMAEYAQGISLNISSGNVEFKGLYISNTSAYIGNFIITYPNDSDSVFEIQQVETNKTEIMIIPKTVGQGVVQIKLENGLTTSLKVIVEKEIESASFAISNENNEYISKEEHSVSESGEINTTKIYVPYTKTQTIYDLIKIRFNLKTNPLSATLYSSNGSVNNNKIATFDNSNNVLTVYEIGTVELTYTVHPQKIQNFKAIDSVDELVFNVTIVIYSPIQKLDFVQDGQIVNQIKICRSVDVGYSYENRSHAIFSAQATLLDGTIIPNIYTYYASEDMKINISTPSAHTIVDNQIIAFGSFERKGSSFEIICNDPSVQVGTSFWFSITITEYNREKTQLVTIIVDDFKPLTSIGFYNYQDKIYLSGVNHSHTFLTFLDSESDCQEFEVKFVPSKIDYTGIFDIKYLSNTTIEVSHIKDKRSGSGMLYFIPQTSILNAEGDFDDSNVQTIFISYSDGTEEDNPELISTADEFIKAMKHEDSIKKHYLIISTLDFSGKDITGFLNLQGTITGSGENAKLINLNINSIYNSGEFNYVSLFPRIEKGAKISNLGFEGNLQLIKNEAYATSNKNHYIGFVAGENLGELNNVTVNILKSQVVINNLASTISTSNVYIGGVVGVNYGTILTNIDTANNTFNHTLVRFNSTFKVAYYGVSTNTALGGVVGLNKGVISRVIGTSSSGKQIVLYNQNINTAILSLEASGITQVGGIAGINKNEDASSTFNTELYPHSIINNQCVTGELSTQSLTVTISEISGSVEMGGQNLGGIVGTNSSYIENSTVRTTLAGFDYIGGVAGYDQTINTYNLSEDVYKYQYLKKNKVQAVKNEVISPMITGISASGHVGAISGNETGATNLNVYGGSLCQNTATYYYVANISEFKYPIFYDYQNNQFNKVPSSDKNCLFAYATVPIEIVGIVENSRIQKLETENDDYENRVVNMFIYKSLNPLEQIFINQYNENIELPFEFTNSDTLSFTSLDENILKINAYGQITLYSVGLATIQVTSLLDSTLLNYTIYINVVNAFDQYKIEIFHGRPISNGTHNLDVYYFQPMTLQYSFFNSNITAKNSFGENISVELVESLTPQLVYSYDTADLSHIYTTITINGRMIDINASKFENLDSTTSKSNIVTFSPIFEVQLPTIGKVYLNSTDPDVLGSVLSKCEKTLAVQVNLKQGTEKIELTYDSTNNIEPLNEIEIFVTQTTDLDNDYLIISARKSSDNENVTKNYFKILDVQGYALNDNRYLKTENQGKFVLQFNYEEFGDTDYEGVYYIIFTADNGRYATLTIKINAQTMKEITLKNFYNVDMADEYNPTQLQSSYLSSGTVNLLEINIYPCFADYDYIFISNDERNYAKNNEILFEVDYLRSDNTFKYLENIIYDANGNAYIQKSVIESLKVDNIVSKLFISYTTISRAELDSFASLKIAAIKEINNVPTPIYEVEQVVTIIAKDSVFFTIDNRETDSVYYVANGLTYDLTLNVHGFTEEQAHFDVVNANNIAVNDVKIVKTNGKYKLVVTSRSYDYSISQQGYMVKIRSYGKNTVDGITYQSDINELILYVVDFVVLTDNLGSFSATFDNINEFSKKTIIAEADGAIVHLTVGNTYNLGVELVNGIMVEYNANNYEIYEKVLMFKQSIVNQANWKVKTTQNGVLGEYTKQITLNEYTNLTTDYLKILGSNVDGDNLNIQVTPLKVNDYSNPNYYFNMQVGFKYVGGVPIATTDESALSFTTDFVFDVFPNTNEENALPIDSYQDFLDMLDVTEKSNYILTTDITLKQDYIPKILNVGSFDGNGHKITFPSRLTFKDENYFGLFTSISANTIVKNVVIDIANLTVINITTTSSITFGTLCGKNDGTITNCSVVSKVNKGLSIIFDNQSGDLEDNYVAGLVGENNGFITNSRVSANLTAVANVAGFVGINAKKIASSYVRDSIIVNKSAFDKHKTAGFVVKNGYSENSNASITTSYVCGTTSKEYTLKTGAKRPYSVSNVKIIDSPCSVSGFVYSNFCKVSNCYSDIVIKTNAVSSGFIFENCGTIEYSYTTCTFTTQGKKSYIFLQANKINSSNSGTIKECFYLGGESTENASSTQEEMNGLTALNKTQFSDETIFKAYAISSNTNKIEAVWFYPAETSETMFKDEKGYMSFTTGKLELVAPNLLTNSQKILDPDNTQVDPITGETKYAYIETLSSYGTYLNPILVSSSKYFEQSILSNTFDGLNKKNYRIISDLSYEAEGIHTISTYNVVFAGILEGNSMEIMNFAIDNAIDNKNQVVNGGFFAQIGESNANNGVVKNLTLSPNYINLPNTQNAGTLAGTLDGGRIFNIICDGYSSSRDGVEIFGVNAVGGVIGYATNNFKMMNVSSSISANATYDHTKSHSQVTIYTDKTCVTKVSYVGTIIGIADEGGSINGVQVNDKCFVVGEVAGLLFGKIGLNVNVENIILELNEEQNISATVYGGVIAGENSGELKDISVGGTMKYDFFNKLDTKSNTSYAVGGIAGLMTGGKIINSNVNVSLVWTDATPGIIGGIVGEMLAGRIEKCNFGAASITAKVIGGNYDIGSLVIGGIVGYITHQISVVTDNTVEAGNTMIYNCSTLGQVSATTVSISDIYIGGIVGQVLTTHKVIDNSFTSNKYSHTISGCTNNLNTTINSTIYGGLGNIYTAGIVGAVFSDLTKLSAGEIIIYDDEHTDEISEKVSNFSTGKMSVNLTDKKNTALVNVYYGGIISFGYSVCETSVISDVPTKSKTFSTILANFDKSGSLTYPSYFGQFDEDENYVEDMRTTDYLSISVNVLFNLFNRMVLYSNEE